MIDIQLMAHAVPELILSRFLDRCIVFILTIQVYCLLSAMLQYDRPDVSTVTPTPYEVDHKRLSTCRLSKMKMEWKQVIGQSK